MAKIHTAMVSVADISDGGHDHNEEVARIVEEHYADGYTLTAGFFCGATGNWPAHIMPIFTHS